VLCGRDLRGCAGPRAELVSSVRRPARRAAAPWLLLLLTPTLRQGSRSYFWNEETEERRFEEPPEGVCERDEEEDAEDFEREWAKMLLAGRDALAALFGAIDADGSGQLSKPEAHAVFGKVDGFDMGGFAEAWTALDADGSGEVSLPEFLAWMQSDCAAAGAVRRKLGSYVDDDPFGEDEGEGQGEAKERQELNFAEQRAQLDAEAVAAAERVLKSPVKPPPLPDEETTAAWREASLPATVTVTGGAAVGDYELLAKSVNCGAPAYCKTDDEEAWLYLATETGTGAVCWALGDDEDKVRHTHACAHPHSARTAPGPTQVETCRCR